MKNFLFTLMALMVLSACTQGDEPGAQATNDHAPCVDVPQVELMSDIDLTTTETQALPSYENYSWSLLNDLTAGRKDNVVCSPVSATSALGLFAAANSRESVEAMAGVFGFESIDDFNDFHLKLLQYLPYFEDKDNEMHLANSVWVSDAFSINPEYATSVAKYYAAEVSNLDFGLRSSVNRINQWCYDKTNGRIPEIVKDLSDDVALFVNATYFKSNWEVPFSKSHNVKRSFFGANGTQPVEMMNQQAQYVYAAKDGIELVRLPFKGGKYTLELMMDRYDRKLTAKDYATLISRAKTRDVNIYLPKFKVDEEVGLGSLVNRLGLGETDLSKMLSKPTFHSIRMKQKVWFEINEQGAEAAAVTNLEATSPEPDDETGPVTICCDHPFYLIIRESKTGIQIFNGKINSL